MQISGEEDHFVFCIYCLIFNKLFIESDNGHTRQSLLLYYWVRKFWDGSVPTPLLLGQKVLGRFCPFSGSQLKFTQGFNCLVFSCKSYYYMFQQQYRFSEHCGSERQGVSTSAKSTYTFSGPVDSTGTPCSKPCFCMELNSPGPRHPHIIVAPLFSVFYILWIMSWLTL